MHVLYHTTQKSELYNPNHQIHCTAIEGRGRGGFRYCTSSLYHLNLSPFYSTPLQAVYKYKVMYSVIKYVFSASVELALLRGLKQSSYFSKGSFNPSGVLVTQFAWLAPAGCTGSDRTKFHWHDKISYQVLSCAAKRGTLKLILIGKFVAQLYSERSCYLLIPW